MCYHGIYFCFLLNFFIALLAQRTQVFVVLETTKTRHQRDLPYRRTHAGVVVVVVVNVVVCFDRSLCWALLRCRCPIALRTSSTIRIGAEYRPSRS